MTRQQCVSFLLSETRSQLTEEFEEIVCERVSNEVPDGAALLTIRVPQVGIFVDISVQMNWADAPNALQGLITVHALARTEGLTASFQKPVDSICTLDAEATDFTLAIFGLRDFIANAVLKALDISASGQLISDGCSITF
jgi:hypothetical protein